MVNFAGPFVQGVLDPIASYIDHPLGHYKTQLDIIRGPLGHYKTHLGHSKESLKRQLLNMTTPWVILRPSWSF